MFRDKLPAHTVILLAFLQTLPVYTKQRQPTCYELITTSQHHLLKVFFFFLNIQKTFFTKLCKDTECNILLPSMELNQDGEPALFPQQMKKGCFWCFVSYLPSQHLPNALELSLQPGSCFPTAKLRAAH